MSIVPYGYRIEHGKAVIEEEKQEQIRLLYLAFLEGNSLPKCGGISGLNKPTPTLWRMVRNDVYRGSGFYPQMVETELIEKVQVMIKERARAPGGGRKKREPLPVRTEFINGLLATVEDDADPFLRAESIYESVVAVDWTYD